MCDTHNNIIVPISIPILIFQFVVNEYICLFLSTNVFVIRYVFKL